MANSIDCCLSTEVQLSSFLNRKTDTDKKIVVFNEQNFKEFEKYIEQLRVKRYWEIAIDNSKMDVLEKGYVDDRPSHRGEFGLIFNAPAVISWAMVNMVSLSPVDREAMLSQ